MAEKHFFEQKEYTLNYLLPYFQKNIPGFNDMTILEIGCAEGGLIDVLTKTGFDATGIELSRDRIDIAMKQNSSLKIIQGDITDQTLPDRIGRKFDLIIMREVIEHVHNKYALFNNLNNLLNENGYLFITFPPKYSPFAGHQQIAKSFLKFIPYLHLLPEPILRPIAKSLNERVDYVDEIKLHYSTGMKIGLFEKYIFSNKLIPVKKELFLFRPIYGYRYNLPKFKIPGIPLVREIVTFGYEGLFKKV
ncbi:MAG TPA: class I SAM-dependent methyltransferase [Melioribacteraceae bacterium]|nr:class I SAM-dependent methyltransferase [Melioribacteraceae bacterium]